MMRAILNYMRCDVMIKTGNMERSTTVGVVPAHRAEVKTKLGWGMYVKPLDCPVYFHAAGEGLRYTAAQVMEMLAEAERLQADSNLVVIEREPPTWDGNLWAMGRSEAT
jgi:hypothetical protein